jgi:L-lysine exporter family protein LysE/ArgO
MISSILSGITLGFGAAVPLGPINVIIMTNALRSYKSAVAVGLGAMSSDLIYFISLYFLGSAFAKNPTVAKLLALFGSSFCSISHGLYLKAETPQLLSKTKKAALKI